MRRCTRCILPETFPGIDLDHQGICNYCRSHRRAEDPDRTEEFTAILNRERGCGDRGDCIVPFSGGRDSTYVLCRLVRDFGMKPIAVTYDWGMMTKTAQRNWAAAAENLGIEHLIIPANVNRVRANARRNILAWLRRPHLGMVPIFTQADKAFGYRINQAARRLGIRLIIKGVGNPYEATLFKTGFLGVLEATPRGGAKDISVRGRAKLLLRYVGQYIRNPAYLNRSLPEALANFLAYYALDTVTRAQWIPFYRYIHWDEQTVLDTIAREAGWRGADDTILTWRIDDATAPFYNFITLTIAGFTENDTFRSNQIREGVIAREEALRLVERENEPRLGPMREYLESLDLDYETIKARIEAQPKLLRQ